MAPRRRAKETAAQPERDVDPLIRVTPEVRRLWKQRREADLGLTTRALASLAGTTHGTISNYESGKQPQLVMSIYIGVLRVLARMTRAEAHAEVSDLLRRQQRQYREAARLISRLNEDQLEMLIGTMRSLAPKNVSEDAALRK